MESSRVESQQLASRLARSDGILFDSLGLVAMSHAPCPVTIAAAEHNGRSFAGRQLIGPIGDC